MKPVEFYVARNGDDGDPGTMEAPFATLEGARDAIQTLKQGELPPGGVTVRLRGGTYMLDDSFRLSAEDSGTPEARITYCAHDGEAVWLVGGRELKAESFVPV